MPMCMNTFSDFMWMLAAHGVGAVISFIPLGGYVLLRRRDRRRAKLKEQQDMLRRNFVTRPL